MKKAAAVLAAMLVGLGGAAWWITRPPAVPPTPKPTWLAALEPSFVRSVRVAWTDGQSATLAREGPWWTLRLGDGPSWPIDEETVRGLIRLTGELERLPRDPGPPPALDGPTIAFELDGGATHTLRLAGTSLGGRCAVQVGEGVLVLAEASYAALFERAGVNAWRRPEAMAGGTASASRLRVERLGEVLELARTQGRWGVLRPVIASGDAPACTDLAGRLGSVRAARLLEGMGPGATGLDSPTAVWVAEIDVRSPDGRTRTLVQELRLGGAGSATGEAVYASGSAWWIGESTERTPAWGPLVLLVPASEARAISPEPGAVLSRVTYDMPAADIRELEVIEAGDGGRSRAKLVRTLDGWAERGDGSQTRPLAPETAAAAGALAALLSEERASAVTLRVPANAKEIGRVRAWAAGGASLGDGVALSVATLPLASGPGEALLVVQGGVARVYPAAKHEPVRRWLRVVLTPEG